MGVIIDLKENRTVIIHDVSKADNNEDVDPQVKLESEKILPYCKYKVRGEKTKEIITEKIMMEWCWDNLSNDCMVVFLDDNIISYFENKEDAVAFKLRWI